MNKLEIKYLNINDLTPYANNPRINDDAVKYVKASIEQFGWKVPVVIDAAGVVIAGHTRLKAAKELGISEVPCIVADDLTEQQVKAFRLADNKVAEMAEWDFELLDKELDDIFDLDMEDFGFFDDFNNDDDGDGGDDKEKDATIDEKYCVCIDCNTEEELQQVFVDLKEEGYNCRISTL